LTNVKYENKVPIKLKLNCGVFTVPIFTMHSFTNHYGLKILIWVSNFFFPQLRHFKPKLEPSCIFFFFFCKGWIERQRNEMENTDKIGGVSIIGLKSSF